MARLLRVRFPPNVGRKKAGLLGSKEKEVLHVGLSKSASGSRQSKGSAAPRGSALRPVKPRTLKLLPNAVCTQSPRLLL